MNSDGAVSRASTSRKRVLLLFPAAPRLDATHGGGRVAGELLSKLVDRHDVGVLYLRDHDEPPLSACLRERCGLVVELPRPFLNLARQVWSRRLLSLSRGRPMGIVDWETAAFGRAAAEAVTCWKPDIIQVEHLAMAQYLPCLQDSLAPQVLTIHEPGTRAARDRVRAAASPMARVAVHLELALWKRFEREALGAVQTAIVFTPQDEAELADRAQGTPIVRIPLGVVLPERPLDSVGTRPPRMCFVGSFIHPPNIDAAMRLASTILPRVRQRIPDAQLDLVGADPPSEVTSLGRPGVTVTGRVPSVVPYLEAAAVVVAPLRRGGGMRVKVLEALAAGKALVASPLAIEGLAVRDGTELIVATTNGEFADAIARLIEDVPLRVALARRAREWASANLGWDSVVAAYERVYDHLLSERAAA